MAKWINRNNFDKNEVMAVSKRYGIIPPISAILLKRGLDIEDYLFPKEDERPLTDAKKGAEIILEAIRERKPICIVNDYDADGITSGVIMKLAIEYFGGICRIITPDRNIDGYGISERIIDEADEYNCQLIVTTDNGISAHSEIAYAKSLGIDVVITDHHQIMSYEENGENILCIPPADAVINPNREDETYKNKEICGAVVAMKLCETMFSLAEAQGMRSGAGEPISNSSVSITALKNKLAELAGIGTVCDVMPIISENRRIVRKSLELLKTTSFIGIKKLAEKMSITMERFSSYNIGFNIGPALNSASRITGSADTATRLLTTTDEAEAERLAETLCGYNEERKKECEECESEAVQIAEDQIADGKKICVIHLPDKNPAILGIVAGRVREATGHPAICITEYDGGLKGSARSVEGYHMFQHLVECKNYLTSFGGHAGAAGLSLKAEDEKAFIDCINRQVDVSDEVFEKKTYVDLYTGLSSITLQLADGIESMEPFGERNEKPVFCSERVRIGTVQTIGSNGQYAKAEIFSIDGSVTALVFKDAERFMRLVKDYPGQMIDILYTVTKNEWNGRKSVEIIITDFRLSE